MRELKKRWNADDRPGLAVSLRPGGLNPSNLVEKIAEAVGEPVLEAQQDATPRSIAQPGDIERILRSDEVPWSLIKDRFGARFERRQSVLLLCEEAQTMTAKREALKTVSRLAAERRRRPVANSGGARVRGVVGHHREDRRMRHHPPTGGNNASLDGLSGREAKEYVLKTLMYLDAEVRQSELSRWTDLVRGLLRLAEALADPDDRRGGRAASRCPSSP